MYLNPICISYIQFDFKIARMFQKLRKPKVNGWQGSGFCHGVDLAQGGSVVTNWATNCSLQVKPALALVNAQKHFLHFILVIFDSYSELCYYFLGQMQ